MKLEAINELSLLLMTFRCIPSLEHLIENKLSVPLTFKVPLTRESLS